MKRAVPCDAYREVSHYTYTYILWETVINYETDCSWRFVDGVSEHKQGNSNEL